MKLFGSISIFILFSFSSLAQQISGTYTLPTSNGKITLKLMLQGEKVTGQLITDNGSTYTLSGYGEEDIAEGTILASNGNQMMFEAYVINASQLEFTIVPNGSVGPDYDKAQEYIMTRSSNGYNNAISQNNNSNQTYFNNQQQQFNSQNGINQRQQQMSSQLPNQQQAYSQNQNNINNNTGEMYHGSINGTNCTLKLNKQGNQMSGIITDNNGYQYFLKGQVQGNQMQGKMTDTGTQGVFDFQASQNGTNIAMLLLIPNQYGQMQQLNLQFRKGNPPVQQQNTGGMTGNTSGQIDNRLVGAWSHSSSSTSGNFGMTSSVNMQLNADGTYFYGNGRVTVGGPGAFGDTGQGGGDGSSGKWKIQNNTIYITEGQSNQWYPYAGYYIEGYKLLLKFSDGSKQVWYRQ